MKSKLTLMVLTGALALTGIAPSAMAHNAPRAGANATNGKLTVKRSAGGSLTQKGSAPRAGANATNGKLTLKK